MNNYHQVCLLLGSNIEPEENIPRAVSILKECVAVIRLSSVWESASSECCYPNYLNMAVLVITQLDAGELKFQVLRPLEARMGRVRTADINAPRTIDIDIILYDGNELDPDLWQQVHRAVPVAELFPKLESFQGEKLVDVARRLAVSNPIRHRPDISINSN